MALNITETKITSTKSGNEYKLFIFEDRAIGCTCMHRQKQMHVPCSHMKAHNAPKLVAEPPVRFQCSEATRALIDAQNACREAGYEFRSLGRYDYWMPQYRKGNEEWVNLASDEMRDGKADEVIHDAQRQLARELAASQYESCLCCGVRIKLGAVMCHRCSC